MSWRSRPVGWRNDSYRHYLAGKGIATKYKRKFPDLVKEFPGENPRITGDYARFRQAAPNSFVSGSFRTKRVADERTLVVGERKADHKFAVQSVLIPRERYWSVKHVFKKGKVHVTRSGGEVRALADDVVRDIRPYAQRVEVAGSIRRGKPDPTDVDVVVIPKEGGESKIRDAIRHRATRIDAEGKHKIESHINGVDVDVMFANKEDYGAQLLRWTGPYGHNIGLSRIAQRRGLKLSQYGLYRGDERIAGRSEREIYRALGRPRFKGPEERM